MRSVFLTVLAALLTIAIVAPVQAEELASENVGITIPCSDCQNTTTTPVLPQGETEDIHPYEDHTWGGDPDYGAGWMHWWDYWANCLHGWSGDNNCGLAGLLY